MTVDVQPNSDPNTVRLFVIRHGQTEHNIRGIMQGHVDAELNDTGRDQADKVGQSLSLIKFDRAHSSDLKRCVVTSEYILKHQNSPPSLETHYGLRERYMGVVQGMKMVDAAAQYGPDFRNMGEKEHQLLERLDKEFTAIIKESVASDDLNVMVCTHGGVLTSYFNYLYAQKGYKLGGTLTKDRLRVPYNTSVAVIDIDRSTGEGTIQDFGNTKHLGADLVVKNQQLR